MIAAARKSGGVPGVDARQLATVLVAAWAVLLSVLGAQALTFPPLTGRVVDEAGILDPATRQELTQKLADFEAKTTDQIVVVTLKSLQGTTIEDYGYQLGRHWGIGQKDKNNGALLIVAPNERKVRIEVGYGLEGDLTDAVSRLIIENAILPRFRVNDYAGGISRGVDDIIQAVSVDPEEWRSRAEKRADHQSSSVDLFMMLLLLIVFIMIVRSVSRQSRYQRDMRRGPWSGGPIIIPPPGNWGSGSSSSGSSWSDSGGFSGGGGSFGGGGASGSW
jgi:uncharacterized protein